MSNKTYSLFSLGGRFIGTISGPFRYVIAPTLSEWDGYHYEGEYDSTYYFHEGEPAKRPEAPTKLNGLVLSEVLAGSEIHIDGEVYPVTETQDVTLSFPFAGLYKIHVIPPFPYLEQEYEIDYQP